MLLTSSVAPPKTLFAFIWHFLRNYKLFVVPFVFLSFLSGFWGPLNSILIKLIIDSLSAGTALISAIPSANVSASSSISSSNMPSSETLFNSLLNSFSFFGPPSTSSLVLWLAIAFVLNFEIHNLCWRGMGLLNYKFQPVIKNQIITQTFSYVLNSSHQFFQNNLAGRIANQITTLADNIERIVHDISRHLLRVALLLVVSFISMYLVNPKFFLALLIWFIIFFTVSFRMSKRLINLSEIHAATESTVSGKLVDSISNINNVRIFARGTEEISFLSRVLVNAQKAFRAKEGFAIKLHFFQGSSLSIMLAVMLYFLIQLYNQQQVTIGDFALILGLSVEVGFMTWWAVEQIDELNKSMGKCAQSLQKLFLPLEITDKPSASILQVPNGKIVFSGVKFHYKNTDVLFQDKSITIEAGQKVGLVGYSGGGKSTFVNLILRIYDVVDGKILIDDQDIRDVTQDSLRSNIAMIPQDPSLFHRSLMENIRYGKIDASDEEVIAAAKSAHAHEFIQKMPQKYHSLVGDRGVRLSGGQRQRIAIARAILKNAPILILDEATSQLDSITEREIQDSLWTLMQNKTTIVVAHRLSTLLHMDRILVFDQGKIVEDGLHKVLLEKNGLYKSLWDAQVGGFLPDQKKKS